MPGMKLIIELDDRGSIRKVDTLTMGVSRLERQVKGGAANVAAGAAKMSRGFSGLTRVFSRMAMIGKLALAALAVASIVVGAKFEQSMANVASVAGATAAQLTELSNVARAWGEQTAYSASAAAEGMYSLASAGLKVAEIKNTIGGVLMYAGAAATSLGEAAEATVQSMKMFGLQAGETNRIVNVFAAGIANSMLTAERLKESMAAIGATAAAMGMTLEDTVGTLGLLHNAGMLGSAAGTRLKNVLSRLAQGMPRVEALLGGMAFNGQNLAEVMQHLSDEGATAGEVFAAFGRIAAPAVLTMMRAGKEEMERMTASVTGTQKAWEMYEIQMNTVASQFKIFKSALQENMIAVFMELKPVIRSALQGMIEGMQRLKPIVIGAVKWTIDFVARNKELVLTWIETIAKGLMVAAAVLFIAKAVGVAVAAYNILHGTLLIGIGLYQILKWSIIKMQLAAQSAWFYTQLAAAHAMASVIVQSAIMRTKLVADWVMVHLAAIGPIGWLIIAVAAAVAAIIILSYKFRDEIKKVLGIVADAFGTAWRWISDKAVTAGEAIKGAFEKPIKWIIDKIRWLAEKSGWLMDQILPGWREKLGGLLETTKDMAGKVGGAVEKAAGATADGVAWAFEFAAEKAGAAVDAVKDKIPDVQRLLSDFMAKLQAMGGGAVGMDISTGVSGDEPDWAAIWNAHFEKRREASARQGAEDFALIEELADKRKASQLETLAMLATHEQAWLATKLALIDDELQYRIDSEELSRAERMQLEIEAAEASAEARMAWEDAVLWHWMDNNMIQLAYLDALGVAYDTFFATILDKEMTGQKRREAMWKAMQRSFIRSVSQMLKQWVVLELKSLLLVNAAKEASNAKERLADAKLGAIKAYQSMASIPIIGPALGVAAAAAAFAFLMAFHSGGMIPGRRDDMAVSVQGGEHMTRRGAVNSATQPTLEYINATGRVPEASAPVAPISLYFDVSGGGNDAEGLQDFIEDDIIPRIEDFQRRSGFKTGEVVLT